MCDDTIADYELDPTELCDGCGLMRIDCVCDEVEEQTMNFQEELTSLVNKHSMENGSNTPDFILAQYILDCLYAYNKATRHRDRWYNKSKKGEE